MMTVLPELQAVTARVEAIERQNRMMKWIGLIALVGIGGVLLSLIGRARSNGGVVEAQQFIVRDSTGARRAILGLDHPTSPRHSPVRVALYNEDKSSAVMYLSNGFAGLVITTVAADGRVQPSAQMFATPKEGAGFKVAARLKKTSVQLSTDTDGTASLLLMDQQGKVRFQAP